MKHLSSILLLLLWAMTPPAFAADTAWVEGTHYFPVDPARIGAAPRAKTSVTEVFSYGCPACNAFEPFWLRLRSTLPAGTAVDYVPASFIPSEAWPMFQRAYLAAQALGIAERSHEAMFAAVWQTGELATMDPATRQIRRTLPTIEDAAKFYQRVAGVPAEQFLQVARSFSIELNMRKADQLVLAYQADSTPTLIVNGRYRLSAQSAGGFQHLVDLAHWLIARDGG